MWVINSTEIIHLTFTNFKVEITNNKKVIAVSTANPISFRYQVWTYYPKID